MKDPKGILVRFGGFDVLESIVRDASGPDRTITIMDWGQPDKDGAYTPTMMIKYHNPPSQPAWAFWLAGVALLLAGAACFLAGRWTA